MSRDLCRRGVEFLSLVYDEEQALFPFTSSPTGDGYTSDYAHPQTRRYTINTLLGLQAARAGGVEHPWLEGLDQRVRAFVDLHASSIEDPADLGLLGLLLVEGDVGGPLLERSLSTARAAIAARPRSLNMQDLAWCTWGGSAAMRAGVEAGEALARTAWGTIRARFVDRRTGLPYHRDVVGRRGLVSFGSLTYFLRAADEYARTFHDRAASELFERGVTHVLALQDERGEWPWMIDARSGQVVDRYPIFTVHQDGMAMLFLRPAADQGLPGAEDAILRSVAWGFGANELGADVYPEEPIEFFRSIERAESAPRLRRYLRYVAAPARSRTRGPAELSRLWLNRETRSYHVGWLLYSWAGRSFPRAPARTASGAVA